MHALVDRELAMRLLLVEDDARLRSRLATRLEAAGFAVDQADNGIDAEYLGDEIDYDAVVLDLGLPQRDGLSVLASWRARGRRLPVLVLTARDAWFEKVEGFKAGADDYLAKPFHHEELVARLRALMRRGGGQEGTLLAWGGLSLDEDCRSVTVVGGRHSTSAASNIVSCVCFWGARGGCCRKN